MRQAVRQILRQVAILRQVVSRVLRPAVRQVLRDLLRRKPPHLKTHLPAHLRTRLPRRLHLKTHLPAHLRTRLKAHPPAHLLCPRRLRRLRLLGRPRHLSSRRLRRLSHLLAHLLLLSFRLYLHLLSSSINKPRSEGGGSLAASAFSLALIHKVRRSEFCELRTNEVLRSSHTSHSRKFGFRWVGSVVSRPTMRKLAWSLRDRGSYGV